MPNRTPGAIPARQASPAAPGTRPFISVARGQPTEAELAAVVTVLAARAAAAAAVPAPARASRSSWSEPSRLMRESVVPGPGAWRRSALPR
ncbi:MAG TPA: acyl-CoA carboxylase epsilon subunit [Streptosporangiaceae bacterium]